MTDEQKIRELAYALVGTLKTRDKALMQSHLFPGFSAKLIRNGTILQLDEKGFLDRLPWDAKEEIEEILTSVDIKVYEDIAVVWAPFYTTTGGKMGTKGTNLITMIKVDGEGKGAGGRNGTWKVSGVFDTSVSCSENEAVPSEESQGKKEWPHV